MVKEKFSSSGCNCDPKEVYGLLDCVYLIYVNLHLNTLSGIYLFLLKLILSNKK